MGGINLLEDVSDDYKNCNSDISTTKTSSDNFIKGYIHYFPENTNDLKIKDISLGHEEQVDENLYHILNISVGDNINKIEDIMENANFTLTYSGLNEYSEIYNNELKYQRDHIQIIFYYEIDNDTILYIFLEAIDPIEKT